MARAIAFSEFAAKVLRVALTPGQRVLCMVAFDGVQPASLEGEDREMARKIFGDVDLVPESARRIQTLLLGRGSGKTTIAAAFGLYQLLTGDVSACGPGDVPVVVVIAPDRRTAALSVRMALEMARAAPDVARLIQADGADGFTLRRHDGRLVGFEAFAASRGGSSVRGRSILSFLLDEAMFFRSDDAGAFVVNDRDMYRALVPRLMRTGRGIFLSTPWPCETLMGEMFDKNFGAPVTALAARAPTLLMRSDDPHLAAMIATERERDPETCSREFDCQTGTNGGNGFFDTVAIANAIDVQDLPLAPVAHHPVAIGADFAFRSDSSALVVVRFDGTHYRVADMLELRPTKGAPLQPSAVVARFAEVAKRYGATRVIADGHYREAIREHLQEHSLYIQDAPEGLTGKLASYSRTRAVLHEGKARLPNNPRLLGQLRAITSRPTPGGGLTITSPRRAGAGHGDLVSAWVLAVHALAYAQSQTPVDTPEPGTPEWHAWQGKKENDRVRAWVNKKYRPTSWDW